MSHKIVQALENEFLKSVKALPDFDAGDTVIVQVKVKEGDRSRLQSYEGVVIAKRNRGYNSAFTVRKISHGVGVERVFLSSRERTIAPSFLLLTSSNRPGNPVTAISLLYSIRLIDN